MKIAITLTILMVGSMFYSQTWKTYPYVPAGSQVSFPLDEGRHSAEPSEWWYTIGHVVGATTGKHYSYMLTYFYYPYGTSIDGFRILNISDDDNLIFNDETKVLSYDSLATDKLYIEANLLGGGVETWKNKMNGTNALPFEYEINASSADVTLSLDYNTTKRPLILGDDGYLLQGDSNYTYYYSQTGIDVLGSITYNGITENIAGLGWIDRQYGTLNPSNGTEYEWFSIQLSNDMDINLWNIFNAEYKVPDDEKFRIFAAYVNDTTQYTSSDFELERLSYAYTPDSVKCYAQSWRLTSPINNVDLTIATLYSNSEVQSPFRFYEGATTVSGTVNGTSVTGVGFTELLHAYEVPDVTIANNGNVWNNSIPFYWNLNNPDDGNPLFYKLEYSNNNQQSYTLIVDGISDTSYIWNTNQFSNGDTFWLKLSGYSIDGTLVGSTTKQFTYDNTVGLSEQVKALVFCYPNPARESIRIKAEDIQKIEIIDSNGKLIRTEKRKIINVKNLKRGSYIVKTYTKSGVFTDKIMLE